MRLIKWQKYTYWVNYLFNDPWAIHSVDYVISAEIDHEYIVTIGNITQP